jgi:hypothetical protein
MRGGYWIDEPRRRNLAGILFGLAASVATIQGWNQLKRHIVVQYVVAT